MTQEIPVPLMARGACSRLEPQPKFVEATMMSPGVTSLTKSGSIPSMACLATASGSVWSRKRPG